MTSYHYASVGGNKIFYREGGAKTAPTILLLHGFPTSSHMFRNLIPALAENYHVVAPDLPGFGFSDAPDRKKFRYTFENLAATIGSFTKAIGLERYAIYVFDYGAPVGFRLALAHPDRITQAMVTTYGLPSQYAGQPIDVTGCMVCHNGQGLATDKEGAHRNLIINIFDVVDRGSVVFKNNCAQCHGQNGEGGIGPPLNDQHRLGFFNDDYYYDCVFYGSLSEHHLNTKMPSWGAKKLFGAQSNE